VHFSDLDKVNFKKDDDLILSFAAHSIAGIDLGIKLKADMIFIAPAFATTSHLDTEPLGEAHLREIALKYKNLDYLYPLGGVNSSNIYLLRNLGFASFGAIDFFNNL
jgi:thiamine monophosphate synthase